jgi:hypothetical protein
VGRKRSPARERKFRKMQGLGQTQACFFESRAEWEAFKLWRKTNGMPPPGKEEEKKAQPPSPAAQKPEQKKIDLSGVWAGWREADARQRDIYTAIFEEAVFKRNPQMLRLAAKSMSPAEFGDRADGGHIAPEEYAAGLIKAAAGGPGANVAGIEERARFICDFIEANGTITKADLEQIDAVFISEEKGGEE